MNSTTSLQKQSELPSEMSLFEHLDELRSRLVKAAVAILVCTIVSTAFTTQIIEILIEPYGEKLVIVDPTEGLAVYFRVAFTFGLILASPFVLYQLIRFILPGLEKHEIKYIGLTIPVAVLLFFTGVAFAWYIMAPAAVGFLSTWQPDIFVQEWRSRNYIPFITSLLFWIGVSFETPLVISILSKMGIVSPRFLIKQWRFAIIIIAIVSAIITPTVDPFNMFLVMLPLIVLYGISIFFSYMAYSPR